MPDKNKTNSPIDNGRRGSLKTVIDLAFIAFCSGLSIFYLFISNLTELRFRETVPTLLFFTGVGWILYLILRFTLKRASQKIALICGIIMAIVVNAGALTETLGYVAALLIG